MEIDYETILELEIPGEKVNSVKFDRESNNFIFGFDYNLKILDINGNELISIELR
mgnify:CR=1 FL=1